MIPKIAHFVWIGGEIPFTEIGNINRFHMIHPNWEIKVWKEREAIELMDDRQKRVCQQIEIPIHKANLIRFLALSTYGGVYMDLDIMVLKNLENILDPDRLTLSNVWLDHWEDDPRNRRSYNNCFAAAPRKDRLVAKIVEAIANSMERFIGTPSHAREVADGYSPYPWPVSGIGAFYEVASKHHDEIAWMLCDEFVEMQTMQVTNPPMDPAIIHGASHNWKRPKQPFQVI